MGFFSSRKTDLGDDSYNVTAAVISGAGGTGGGGEKSVVKVIRSRFYGKKGKEREEPINYIPQGASVAQTLAIGSPVAKHSPATSSPLAGSSKGSILKRKSPAAATSLKKASSSAPSTPFQDERPLPPTPPPPTPAKKRLSIETNLPMTPIKDRHSAGVKVGSSILGTPSTPSRVGTDAVTATLAQRLNELAVANADGLLSDDEYRLLRQNLFERFSSASAVPSEAPVVPAVRPRLGPGGTGPSTPERAPSRPLSNFQVELPRPGSSQSRYSITSGVASLFRRTSTTVPPQDTDASSVWSQQSNTSSRWNFGRILSRKSSNSSMQTTASRKDVTEMMSNSPRRERGGSVSRPGTPHRRRLATPPSSFPGGMKQQENRFPNSSIYNVFDEDHLSSTAEIQQEILAVEAEVKRLMDAFTGLEVTTLSKTKRSRGYSLTRSDAGRTSNVGSTVDTRSTKRLNLAESDADAGSTRSWNSAGTLPSMGPKSVHSTRIGLRPKTSITASLGLSTTSSRPGSLRRKNSSSSTQSHGVGKSGTAPPIPVPPLPGHPTMNGANGSSVSLARSAQVMASVPEDDSRSAAETVTTVMRMDEDMEDGDEMEDIRRRREEVQQRYGARLDYLRAKLKSAELHEKLMRR